MPQLILDKAKCLKNIERMANKAREKQLSFRPHCKTHQSVDVALWFKDFGVNKITVSSFKMAAYFAKAGWTDILVAFPFDPGQLSNLNAFTKNVRISILIDNPDILPHFSQLEQSIAFYLDIDTGYGRTGVKSESPETAEHLIRSSQKVKGLHFAGFYCHAGNSYQTADPVKREEAHIRSLSELTKLKKQFSHYHPRILYGDTPNCSTQTHFEGIDEITPGNFVFYDLIQHALGACQLEEIAVAMACPVVGRYPLDSRLVIHGGAVHFSKETLAMKGKPIYGQRVRWTGTGWECVANPTFISGISQEHGIIEDCGEWIEEVSLGDTLHFLPVHSCLTANLMRGYLTTEDQLISTLNS